MKAQMRKFLDRVTRDSLKPVEDTPTTTEFGKVNAGPSAKEEQAKRLANAIKANDYSSIVDALETFIAISTQ